MSLLHFLYDACYDSGCQHQRLAKPFMTDGAPLINYPVSLEPHWIVYSDTRYARPCIWARDSPSHFLSFNVWGCHRCRAPQVRCLRSNKCTPTVSRIYRTWVSNCSIDQLLWLAVSSVQYILARQTFTQPQYPCIPGNWRYKHDGDNNISSSDKAAHNDVFLLYCDPKYQVNYSLVSLIIRALSHVLLPQS